MATLFAAPSAAGHRAAPAPLAGRLPSRRLTAQKVHASAAPSATAKPDVSSAVETLKKAAADASVPAPAVFNALLTLEAAKLKAGDDWAATIGGSAPPGNRWRLVYTSGAKVNKWQGKGQGAGGYFPLTACQKWDASSREIVNGIFLGRLAALTFSGPYQMEGKILGFDFDTLTLRLGGWSTAFPLKQKLDKSTWKRTKEGPFFAFFYVDDSIICARGRGGGVAIWARTTPSWELEKGIF